MAFGFHLLGAPLSPMFAGDWPQILGPQRNGVAEGEKLAGAWPAAGPTTLWQHSVGNGFAGVAAAGGRLIVFHRRQQEELVECLDAASGKPLWKTAFPTNYAGGYVADDGPRAVPLIAGDRVFVYGAGGELHGLTLSSGKKLWSRDCAGEFKVPDGYFGAGSSPILEGGKLLLNVGGGRDQAGLVAFDPATGKTVWKATDEAASYSSPVAATVGGVRHVLFATRLNAVSIDPANGAVRFRFPFGARGPTVNAANPVVVGDHVFLTASYGVGAVWAKIGATQATTVWKNDDTLSSQYTTPVPYQGLLYGVDGRQDGPPGILKCFDPATGKSLWSEEGFGIATLIVADGKLILLKTDGNLVLAEATPKAYQQLAAAKIFNSTTRALPALSGGRLYVRDDATLKCLDLQAR